MKRAIIVGIDHYPDGQSLGGCVADATALDKLLSANADGSPNWRTQLITGEEGGPEVTRDGLRHALTQLFGNARDTDLLFFFAGHGAQTPWGADLVTQDATDHTLGVSMNDLITLANDSPARSVTLILDCCFSGDLGNTPGQQAAAVAESFRLNKSILRENVTILAASRAIETSQEVDGHGAFTRVLLDGLEGGATDHLGKVTALSLYGYVSPAFDAWQQRPVFKANLTEPVALRIGPPWLDAAMLRRLPEHFPEADSRVRLSPEHEGEGRPLPPGTSGTPKQQQFDYFGRLRNANLVTTDGKRDHYWVAMESGEVYLTPMGQYFWKLAKRKVL
ncbi:caspase family protein [Streptomyces ficellus]|uniref:Peptidase C14 caspase catalytic subunit P20 n=1 Tax=Streptomyces ficellus TaxID=1977088 RepID=A0A1W5T2F0_9ACTN|nr:caspase family protein [Streptomyces ficellus]ARF06197.1 peptidase C14 caspase catalytic subunit P20 [Streptomyces ficellus]